MAKLTLATGAAAPFDSLDSNASDFGLPIGTRAYDSYGDTYRFCQMGAVDSVAGSLYQSAAPIANHLALTAAATAIGATSLTVTPGATAGAANLYAGGIVSVDTTPGNGYALRISGHPAITASTAFTLQLAEPIQVALTTSSRYGLIHNRFKNCIVCPTTVTGAIAGWAISVIPATYYGWLKTRGPVSALINGTPAVGTGVTVSATTAGAVDVAAVAAEINVRIVGHIMQVGVSTKNNAVYALLD